MSLGNTQGFEQNRGSGLGRLSRGFASGQAGTVYLLGAFALPVMLGMAGLGFDATLWLMDKRENQSVADHSALAAAMTYTRNNDDLTKATDVAKAEALRNGFAHGVDGDVQVAVLANCGPNNTAANCIEVIVSQPSTPLLAGIVFNGPVTIESRAVTALRPRGDACILALDTQMAGALEFGGSSNSAVNCGVASNSAHAQSIVVSGNADLSAEPAVAVGGIEEQGSGSLTTDYPPIPYSQPLDDPYASLAVPTYTSCDETALVVNDTRTMSPGTYCDGLTFGEGANATLDPGVYQIYNGDLVVTSTANVTGAGITFFFTGTTSADVGGLTINGDGAVTLSAPGPDGHESGPYLGEYAGLLFFQDPAAESTSGGSLIKNKINGSAALDLLGAFYFPSQALELLGSANFTDGCVQIVARQVTMSGNATISNDEVACEDAGIATIAQQLIRLVE